MRRGLGSALLFSALFMSIFCVGTTPAQDVAEPSDPDNALILPKEVEASIQCVQKTYRELLNGIKAITGLDNVEQGIKKCRAYREQLLELTAEFKNSCTKNERVVASYLIEAEQTEFDRQMKENFLRLKKLKFFGSPELEELFKSLGYVEEGEKKVTPGEEMVLHLFEIREIKLGALAQLYTVTNQAEAEAMAEKLKRYRSELEKALKEHRIPLTMAKDWMMPFMHAAVFMTDEKAEQKARLGKADFFGSRALKEAWQFWDALIPDDPSAEDDAREDKDE